MKPFDLAVIIGRFQPFHLGHLVALQAAAKVAPRVLVLVGSTRIARNTKNPFTFEERAAMIHGCADQIDAEVLAQPLIDHLYSDADWISQVQAKVETVAQTVGAKKITLVGHKKDHTSFYLDYFPQWEYTPVNPISTMNATDLRDMLFEHGVVFGGQVPKGTHEFLKEFAEKPEYKTLSSEWQHLRKYREGFKSLPYEPIFVTCDAVVVNAGHILLVKRKSQPGKGLWALPGGFIKPEERVVDGILRELKEETRLPIHDKFLKASLKGVHVFDAPGRSLRGRTITHAGLIVLHEPELPKVRGSDDAARAKWFPIHEFLNMPEQTFEDHWSIGTFMLGRAG